LALPKEHVFSLGAAEVYDTDDFVKAERGQKKDHDDVGLLRGFGVRMCPGEARR